MSELQSELALDGKPPTLQQHFDAWADTPGGRHVLKDLFRKASYYASRYHRTGQRVSVRLLWEQERDQIREVKRRLKRHGSEFVKLNGYALNDHLHAYVGRFIENRRPDWHGMFEKRTVGKKPKPRPIFVKEGTVVQVGLDH